MKNTHSGLILSRDYTRRESLQLLGLGATATMITPVKAKTGDVCTLAPELTVGPYYVDKERIRSDITENKPGIPLLLRITVLDAMKCTPIKNAAVDLWHCDARGYYSGYTANDPDSDIGFGGGGPEGPGGMGAGGMGAGGPPPGGRPAGGPPGDRPDGDDMQFSPPTDQLTFFRGVQFTNARGVAEFRTIYPGWYFSRAIHIHLKVHSGSKAEQEILTGGHVCHIGQLAFPDDLTDRVAEHAAYANRKLVRTRNDEDTVFDAESAALGMVKLTARSTRDIGMGFVGEVALTVDPAITPKSAPMLGGPPRTQPG